MKGYRVHTAVCNGVMMFAATCNLNFYMHTKYVKKVWNEDFTNDWICSFLVDVRKSSKYSKRDIINKTILVTVVMARRLRALIACSSRAPRFGSWDSHCDSKLYLTPFFRNSLCPLLEFWDTRQACGTQIHMRVKPIHILNF